MPDGLKLDQVCAKQARRFYEVLELAGYNIKAITEPQGGLEFPSQDRSNLPRLLRLTADGTALSTLLRLFLLNVPVSVESARRATEPVPLEEWRQAGLVSIRGGETRGIVSVVPFEGLLLATDPPILLEGDAREDFVPGLTNSTFSLAFSIIGGPKKRTLDLGTGCGVFALLAAERSETVIATDVNERALQFARFNAAWNGKTNIEFRMGDSFEPVQGSEFDFIVANPPCIISPLHEYTFRDSGMDLDGFCRKLAKEVPPFLMEGGFFQITLQWAHLRGEDWHQRLAEWFQGSGCDALVLRLETKDPILHAEETVCDTGRASPKEREENFNKIVRYFGEKGVEAVSGGFIVMRRRSGGANWVRFEDLQNRELVPFGDAITAAFEAKDFLAGLRKREDLLSIKPRVAPNVAIESKHCSNDTGWEEGEYFLHQQKGFRLRARVDVHTVNLLRRCDGHRTLRDIMAETAMSLHLDPQKVTAGTVELANRLIERGFLLRSQ